MNNTIKLVALGLSLLLATVSVAYAQDFDKDVELLANRDFDKGLVAERKGDYAAALREWMSLAQLGHARQMATFVEWWNRLSRRQWDH